MFSFFNFRFSNINYVIAAEKYVEMKINVNAVLYYLVFHHLFVSVKEALWQNEKFLLSEKININNFSDISISTKDFKT